MKRHEVSIYNIRRKETEDILQTSGGKNIIFFDILHLLKSKNIENIRFLVYTVNFATVRKILVQ